GALLGLLALYGLGGFGGVVFALLMLLLAAVAIFIPLNGRTLDEWAPVVVRWYSRHRRGGGDYRSSSPGAGVRVGEEEYVPSLPVELEGLELLSVPYGPDHVGVMCDRREDTYTVALAVRAGAFALRDEAEQERSLYAWAGVLAGCARDGSPIRRLQWIERTVPGQGDDLASYMQEKRDRSVPLDSNMVRSYIELLESAAPVTQEHEVLLALQIDYSRGAREIKRLGGGDEGACALLLREAEALAQRLGTAEITVFGLLRPRQYAEVIRDAFDPFGHQGRARAALGDPEREGVDPALMGPLADETSWSHYRTDSACHCTYWVSSWPRSDVGPTFLAPLLMQGAALRTVSVTIEPVPYSEAMRKAEMAQTAEVAEEMGRNRQGQMTTARTRRRQQASSRREEELADGHAELRVAAFIDAYNTPELFEKNKSDVEHGAQLARLELQPLWGEQEAGFANTLPLCRGLQ
ncbi:MAG TPA: SCO6880 family protein, partial [Solirubrobacterales bacterium]|nr:SCO6880 family protein [Solirubrobacterales bacterium]